MSRKPDPLEVALAESGKIAWSIFKSLYQGALQLRRKTYLVIFLLSFLLSVAGYFGRSIFFDIQDAPIWFKYALYVLALGSPLIVLYGIGSFGNAAQKRFDKVFASVGFVGRDKKHPRLTKVEKQDKKEIYTFKSNIALKEWNAVKERIETGLDCNILLIQEGKSKKHVVLTTVPSDYKIPEKIFWKEEFLEPGDGVITVGENALGKITFDLNRTPHFLAAGESGSGKSVVLRSILWQLIRKGARVIMIDFKGGVEFGLKYEQYGEVIMDRERALEVLRELLEENAQRMALFRQAEVKNLKEYNQKTGSNLCRIGLFIDEIAEMLDKRGVSKADKELMEQLEGALSTLARLSRATGINLFFGVQRPDANVLTGQIKNNISVRISGRFADKPASEIVLGTSEAVNLPDLKGRFLYKVGADAVEFQGYYFDDETMLTEEVDAIQGDMLTEKGKAKQELHIDPVPSDPTPIEEPQGEIPKAPTEKGTVLNLNFRKSKAKEPSTGDPDEPQEFPEAPAEKGIVLNLNFRKSKKPHADPETAHTSKKDGDQYVSENQEGERKRTKAGQRPGKG